VRLPFDLGDVDAFLDHLVERGELAELLDRADDLDLAACSTSSMLLKRPKLKRIDE
jgi:hypothetical protein